MLAEGLQVQKGGVQRTRPIARTRERQVLGPLELWGGYFELEWGSSVGGDLSLRPRGQVSGKSIHRGEH